MVGDLVAYGQVAGVVGVGCRVSHGSLGQGELMAGIADCGWSVISVEEGR